LWKLKDTPEKLLNEVKKEINKIKNCIIWGKERWNETRKINLKRKNLPREY
jgi:hypothetical protein